MPMRDIDELRFLGGALISLGAGLGIAAAAAGLLAADHMAAAAAFCGPTTDHCSLCLTAAALAVASLGAAITGIELVSKPRVVLTQAP